MNVLNKMTMPFANKIKQLREEGGLLQRQLAATLEIDTPMYSKIERGDRRAKREQVVMIAKLYQTDEKELLTLWLADQVAAVVADEKDIADKALNIVKDNIKK
jgi:transcriptional regulator with XRE-family HTH domain